MSSYPHKEVYDIYERLFKICPLTFCLHFLCHIALKFLNSQQSA